MALSFCSNWESLQHLNSEILISCSSNTSSCFDDHQQPQVPQLQELPSSGLLSFNNNNNKSFESSDNFIDPFMQSDHDLFYANLPPYFSPSDALISLSPELLPLEDFDSYNLPKRQKSYANDHYDSNFTPNLFYGYLPDPPLVPECLPEVPAPLTELHVPAPETFSCGKTENVKKATGSSLSVQSIAARERRRKITEKTQELGKLIPGGHRMNTAEMFQAASKYVKFLQAQVKVLQVMQPKQETKEPFHAQELQTLLASPVMQEKLYSEEKCLVPKEFVETLAIDPEIQSKPMIIERIDQLLRVNDQS